MTDILKQIDDLYKQQELKDGLKNFIAYMIEKEKYPPNMPEKLKNYVKQEFGKLVLKILEPCSNKVKKEIDEALARDDVGVVVRIMFMVDKLRGSK